MSAISWATASLHATSPGEISARIGRAVVFRPHSARAVVPRGILGEESDAGPQIACQTRPALMEVERES